MSERFPGIWVEAEPNGQITITLVNSDGSSDSFPPVTPAEDLLAAISIDYTDYRRNIQRLYDEQPLFEPKLDIPVAEFEDLAGEAMLLSSAIEKIDPIGFFDLGSHLTRCLMAEDDGSASFLLYAGQAYLKALEYPILTQICLNNIFEIAFDMMERATQQERFEKVCRTYPEIAPLLDPSRLGSSDGSKSYYANSLYGLRLLELALYFQQDQQRIARCEHCWGYFIPKTKKKTLYCDRIFDGKSCKELGPNLMRHRKPKNDDALRIYKQLRDRMYARMTRFEDAPPDRRQKLIRFGTVQYGEWSAMASEARLKYAHKEITAEEFLQRIDTMHDLTSYKVKECKLIPEPSKWQQYVADNIAFDPKRAFPETMMFLDLEKGKPQWESFASEQLQKKAQEGHLSLQKEYRDTSSQEEQA